MSDWKAQYLADLTARDELEKADVEIFARCTRLADANATLKAELRKLRSAAISEALPVSPAPAPLISYGFRRQASPQIPAESDVLLRIRQEFAAAQQERADLQLQVALLKTELASATSKFNATYEQGSRTQQLNTRLTTRLRDREEELRGKAKLLVNVQDENATLNLELNQAESEVKRVKQENKDLVDRWVVRMGEEAEKMNVDSKFS